MSVGSGGCWLGPSTLMLAVAVLPFPPSVDVTADVTLFCIPVAVAVTFTAKLQDVLALSVAPARLTLVDPGVAVIVPLPQLPVSPLGVETAKPAGNASVKPTPLSKEPVLGFDSVNVSEVELLT
jgi:hypothetical protein